MQQTERLSAQLRDASSLPEVLDASFEAFEFIRQVARGCEDQIPALFPAFITAAEAAVEGRECVTSAPSLPPPFGQATDPVLTAPGTDAEQGADALAALAAHLGERLIHAAAQAAAPADRAACGEAAEAARAIHQLLVRANDDPDPR